jgi:hypothetical protein
VKKTLPEVFEYGCLMSKSDYKRGLSAGARNEHDIIFAALMDHREGLLQHINYAYDPDSLIARTEEVLYCMNLLRRVGTHQGNCTHSA